MKEFSIRISSDEFCIREVENLIQECYPLPPRDVSNKTLDLFLQNPKIYTLYLQLVPIGFAMLMPYSKGGHLEALSVSPQHRRCSYASKIISFIISDARSNNLSQITLTTKQMVHLYERMVFVILAISRRFP